MKSRLLAGTVLILASITATTAGYAQWLTTCQPGAVNMIAATGGELFIINDGQAVWLSPDSGKTWTTVLSDAQVGSVLMSAIYVNNRTLFIGTEGNGVVRSSDNGQDWLPADSGMPAGAYNYITAFGAVGDTVFAATNGLGVFRTFNEGLTWTEADSGLPNKNTSEVSSFSSAGSVLFASTAQGVYKTTDCGASWFLVSGSVAGGPSMVESCGSNILAPMQYQESAPPYGISWYLALSTDGGSSWISDSIASSSFPAGVEIIAFCSSGNTVLAETNESGIYRSTDAGLDWSDVSNGIFGVNSLYGGLTFQGPNIFSAYGENLFESRDDGANWNLITNGMPGDTSSNSSMKAIDYDRTVMSLSADDSALFAGTDGEGVYESRDDGITWTAANYGLPYQCDVNTITNIGDSVLIAGVGGAFVPGTIYRSSDDGASWIDVNNGISVNTGVNQLASYGSRVLAAASSGGYLSTDGGVNWSLISGGSSGFPLNTSIAAAFAQGSTFFAGGSGTGILVSTDGGTQWVVSDSGVPANVSVSSFGGDGNDVFAVTSSGLYRSTDDGVTWAAADSGFPAGTSFNLCRIAGDSGVVVAAVSPPNNFSEDLEFLSTDGGRSWTPLNQGVPLSVNCVLIDNNRVFTGIAADGGSAAYQWGVWYWQLAPVTGIRNEDIAVGR
ncbi:MAG: hypothetical protein M1378_00770, partial [Bacteroidetes bacterium]|nr:hypothetical protein [Bacteroidota bacterium]